MRVLGTCSVCVGMAFSDPPRRASAHSARASWPRRGPRGGGHGYRGRQSADCRAVRARCARRGRRGRLGGPSGCVQGLGCTPRPLERGLGICERRTGTPVARFGFQGARAGLAPRGGRCGIPVCTIARFGCRSHRYRLRRAPGPMSPNDGFMSAGPTPCVSSPPAKDRPTRFLQ